MGLEAEPDSQVQQKLYMASTMSHGTQYASQWTGTQGTGERCKTAREKSLVLKIKATMHRIGTACSKGKVNENRNTLYAFKGTYSTLVQPPRSSF